MEPGIPSEAQNEAEFLDLPPSGFPQNHVTNLRRFASAADVTMTSRGDDDVRDGSGSRPLPVQVSASSSIEDWTQTDLLMTDPGNCELEIDLFKNC